MTQIIIAAPMYKKLEDTDKNQYEETQIALKKIFKYFNL